MLTKRYTISCEIAGCTTKPISVEQGQGPVDGPGLVMRAASEAGWRRYGRDRHACPLHHSQVSQLAGDGPDMMLDQPGGYRGVRLEGITAEQAAEGMARGAAALRETAL